MRILAGWKPALPVSSLCSPCVHSACLLAVSRINRISSAGKRKSIFS